MKFCAQCKRLIPRGHEGCPFCSKDFPSKEQNTKASDKRKGFVRIPFNDVVRFQVLSLNPQGNNLELEAKARNISLSGIYFDVARSFSDRASSYLKVSNILWIEFRLPSEKQPIKTQCEIRRVWDNNVDGLGVGVMFINISRPSYKLIDKFISSALEGKDEI